MVVRGNSMKKYTAEFFGTFALVVIGFGSAVIPGNHIGSFGIAFSLGLTLLSMVYAIGGISGCHVNPAITVDMLIDGKIKPKVALE